MKQSLLSWCFVDDEEDELKPTKDGQGWICGDDIDVSIEDEAKGEASESTSSQKQTQESLEEEIGVGESQWNVGTKAKKKTIRRFVGFFEGTASNLGFRKYLTKQSRFQAPTHEKLITIYDHPTYLTY